MQSINIRKKPNEWLITSISLFVLDIPGDRFAVCVEQTRLLFALRSQSTESINSRIVIILVKSFNPKKLNNKHFNKKNTHKENPWIVFLSLIVSLLA